MKFAIIAAGEGSRLTQEGVTCPKPLVEVGGEPLIIRLIRVFMSMDATEICIACNEQMPEVVERLREIQLREQSKLKKRLPLRVIPVTTPSSMHSFYALSEWLAGDEPFVLTTVDTVFRADEFSAYVKAFRQVLAEGYDGLMGVTDYIDDEKPLYVGTDNDMMVTGFYDDVLSGCKYISGGIYGLTPSALTVLRDCVENGVHRMRNFQRSLVASGKRLKAYSFSKILDVDHQADIEKAERFLAKHPTVIGLARAEEFSPNSVEKDRAILEEVVERLNGQIVSERDFLRLANGQMTNDNEEPLSFHYPLSFSKAQKCVILNMGRLKETQDVLKKWEQAGAIVVNPARGVENCRRSRLDALMREKHLPVPPQEGNHGYWLKRGDMSAQVAEDVVFCKDLQALDEAKARFARRGLAETNANDDVNFQLKNFIVQAHVPGDLVKFYGVEGTGFFRIFYPQEDGDFKFGDEQRNGLPQYYSFQKEKLQSVAEYVSRLTETPVYGGDAIIKSDGDFVIIDFNDWPSFSRCRDDAAAAICLLVNGLRPK